MRAPAMTGGATAFASAALADELPLLVAEASAPFGSCGSERVPRTSTTRRSVAAPAASTGAGVTADASVGLPVLPSASVPSSTPALASVSVSSPTPDLKSTTVVPSMVAEGDRLLLGLAAVASVVALPIASATAEVLRRSAWRTFGYETRGDFTRERLQREPRWMHEQARLHAVLEKHPQLVDAFCGLDGGTPLGQVASVQIGRVATAETLLDWIDRARTLPLAELRAAVAEAYKAQADPSSANDCMPGVRVTGRSIAAELEEAEENRILLRRDIPPDVKLIFNAGLELFRNHAGCEASMSGYIQALTGEASSSGIVPPDDFRPRLRRLSLNRGRAALKQRGKPPAQGKAPSAQELRQWRALQTPAMRRARQRLLLFEQKIQGLVRLRAKLAAWDADGGCSFHGKKPLPRARVRALRRLVGVLQSLVRFEGGIAIDIAALLLELHEHRAWELLGYPGLESYVEDRLGLGGSMARQRVALSRELRRYYRVSTAYERRVIGFVATQWVTRTLRPTRGGLALQAHWVRHAKERTVKRLRDESRSLECSLLEAQVAVAEALTSRLGVLDLQSVNQNPSGGRGPSAESDNRNPSATHTAGVNQDPQKQGTAKAARRYARSNVPIGSAAAIARALASIGRPMSDASWFASLHRVPGETRFRAIALGQGLLGRVTRNGPVTETTLSIYLNEDDAVAFLGCVEQARRMLLASAATKLRPGEERQTFPSAKIAAEYVQQKQRVPEWVGLLALLEDWLWTHDDPDSMPDRQGWRERALAEAGFRCMAPGCTSRRNLQVHHIHYRGHQGGEEPWNLLVLCEFHHQQGEHGTLARFRGKAPLGVLCRIGDREVGTWWRNERRIAGPH